MTRTLRRWLPWLLGLGLLVAVIVAATDLDALWRAVRVADAGALFAAVGLQALAVLSEAEGWRVVARVGGAPIGGPLAWRLSLTKVFVDQALPSAGLSGTAAFAAGLSEAGVPRPVVMAAVLVDLVAYLLAYAVCLVAALCFAAFGAGASGLMVGLSIGVSVLAAALAGLVLWLPGRTRPRAVERRSLRLFGSLRGVFAEASPSLVRHPRVLVGATACQVGVFALDATTLWVLVQAVGGAVSFPGVFASHMGASLARTLGVVPGGLGVFEAASVAGLTAAGLGAPEALAATLLFRGMSFWLPLPLGLWLSRHLGGARAGAVARPLVDGWSRWDVGRALSGLSASRDGLSSAEAARRRARPGGWRRSGARRGHRMRHPGLPRALGRQLGSPLVLLLIAAAVVAGLTQAWLDAGLIVAIVAVSALLGALREHAAERAAERLAARIQVQAVALRDGRPQAVHPDALVPGDVVLLGPGQRVPADGLLLEASELHVSEAMLTGESFPVRKAAAHDTEAAIAGAGVGEGAGAGPMTAAVFLGSHVVSGEGRALVVATGDATRLGAVAEVLAHARPETAFARDLRRLGAMLAVAMLALVLLVFGVHVLLGRAPVETLLFAVALAVGLSPELLPAIVHLNLARAAGAMARRRVIVRRLSAIENLGGLDILCTDKTGTLTEGVVEVGASVRCDGTPDPEPLGLASWTARLLGGVRSPLDAALAAQFDETSVYTGMPRKLGEIPFDPIRKRASVAVSALPGLRGVGPQLIVKGAIGPMLAVATTADGRPLDAEMRARVRAREVALAEVGVRTLAVGVRAIPPDAPLTREAERDLDLRGLVTFLDRPKPHVAEVLAGLRDLGVAVKVITGDSAPVACHVWREVGLGEATLLTGEALDAMHDEALWHLAPRTDVFAAVDPNQKARIIRALQHMGHVVGFMGDGVNDAPALHVADAGISVEGAVDVAREAADFVLLERDLAVVQAGVEEGRRSFINTRKYVLTTTSANLGNMVTMAVISPLLPFLPLTAGQILLNNFLSDIPAFGLATDRVDPELLRRPVRWDLRALGRFMVSFGVLSSIFDLLTIAALMELTEASPATFRTAWFVESLLTELAVALVLRTRRSVFASRPGAFLGISTAALVVLTLALPSLPWASALGFAQLPAWLMVLIVGITLAYVAAAELLKRSATRLQS